MHLSYKDFEVDFISGRQRFTASGIEKDLDDHIFYSVPTSFFVLDQRVPRILRELLTEAEGSLKGNFLTGASACARKIVYELAIAQGIEEGNYEDRIKTLKERSSQIEPVYFDTLLTIQQVTSSKVHENAYDGWDAKHVRLILASLREVLHELYVVPALRADGREAILRLKAELLPDRLSEEREGSRSH